LDQTRAFIERLIGKHNENCEGREENARFEDIRNFNENARCLLCTEIEESGTRKHCLGNLVSASALGRIGILVRARHRYSERSYDSAHTSTSWQRYKKIPLKSKCFGSHRRTAHRISRRGTGCAGRRIITTILRLPVARELRKPLADPLTAKEPPLGVWSGGSLGCRAKPD